MNPLLSYEFLIPFDRIRTEHVVPGIRQALREAEEELTRLTADDGEPSYAETIQRLDDLTERLGRAIDPVTHLVSVMNTPELREAYNAVLPEFSAFFAKLPLNERLWQALKSFAETPEARALTGVRRRHLEKTLRSFIRAGADLPPEQKARVEQIQVELSQLHTRFADNSLDATNAFELLITDPADLAGLPETAITQARANAQAHGKEGWRFTLQLPSYIPFMQYAERRSLREKLYQAYMNRAAEGEIDNRPLIPRILELRRELANLVGYRDFADYRLEENMVGSGERALDFERNLTERTRPFWEVEVEAILAFAQELGIERLEPWDTAFVAERLRQARYQIDDEALRPYFPLEAVLEGMFEIAQRLFGITVTERPVAQVWHPEVRFYDIHDEDGVHRGSFYADWFPRESKRSGAWMDAFITGGPAPDGGFEPHLGLIVGNFTPPAGDGPALLTHHEVETTFHEFGHLLHHCLSRVEVRARAGTRVPHDWVELPSQIMENWCWEKEALDLFARHHRTGDAIPDDLYQRMWAARIFMRASQQMRQLSFGTVDLELHMLFEPDRDRSAVAFAQEVMSRFAIRPGFARNHFICTFNHVFTGGYAAGYYSYLWSAVLDADAFTRFKEEGIFNRETGRAYVDAVLARGDSADPADLFREFLGRDPDPEALLRRSLGDPGVPGTPAGAATPAGLGPASLRPDTIIPGG
jgi:oligopeptidase A